MSGGVGTLAVAQAGEKMAHVSRFGRPQGVYMRSTLYQLRGWQLSHHRYSSHHD